MRRSICLPGIRTQHDAGFDFFVTHGVWNADDDDLLHRRVLRQDHLDLSRSDILTGAPNAEVELDRRAAIRGTIGRARPGDVVIVAGKGHEDYQIIGSARMHFDDRDEVRAALA